MKKIARRQQQQPQPQPQPEPLGNGRSGGARGTGRSGRATNEDSEDGLERLLGPFSRLSQSRLPLEPDGLSPEMFPHGPAEHPNPFGNTGIASG
ncbi:hypothetical protein WISP_00983 [Willisornis vidua]|uniref:Uncharacterized protein n=1 Tax=Willisornis vidua TaxID=1566151 RepID=A0ABQ9E027_9PASS|nr:hypothetical protein WISP_00983 [Willisornis vidua]